MKIVVVKIFAAVIKGDKVGRIEVQLSRVHANSEGLGPILQRLAPSLVISSDLLPGPASIPGCRGGVNLPSLNLHASLDPTLTAVQL